MFTGNPSEDKGAVKEDSRLIGLKTPSLLPCGAKPKSEELVPRTRACMHSLLTGIHMKMEVVMGAWLLS